LCNAAAVALPAAKRIDLIALRNEKKMIHFSVGIFRRELCAEKFLYAGKICVKDLCLEDTSGQI
jgi:hypothetical protein